LFFLSLVNDTHILHSVSILSFAFDHFISWLMLVGLIVQPHVLNLVPFKPPSWFFPFYSFYWPPNDIKVLGIPFGSTSFFASHLRQGCSPHRGAPKVGGCLGYFWYIFSMFCPKAFLFVVFFPPFLGFGH
jgi:hypothetical protein